VTSPDRPSGAQWTIRHGDHEVVVVEVGGGLRTYTHHGVPVVSGYGPDEQAGAGRGQLLMPWPNRVRDGRISFHGHDLQLALTEPARGNAIHGLVRWDLWALEERSDSAVTLSCRLRPQQGWVWSLDLRVTYALGDDGLTVTPWARNVGEGPAPFGFGAHPYLTVGEDRVDEVELQVPARTWLETDAERLLPVARHEVAEGRDDFRRARAVGGAELDTAFTDLQPDDDGRVRVVLRHPGTGRTASLWVDAAYRWLQVFTGDSLSADRGRTSGIAVEPMTCPPDALSTGDDLVTLDPGQEWSGSWGITPG